LKQDEIPFDLSNEASAIANGKVPHSSGRHKRFPKGNLQIYGKADNLTHSAMRQKENGETDEPVFDDDDISADYDPLNFQKL